MSRPLFNYTIPGVTDTRRDSKHEDSRTMTKVIGTVHVHIVGKDECDVFPGCRAVELEDGQLHIKRGIDKAILAKYCDGHWSGYAIDSSNGTLGANERGAIPVDDEGEDDGES